MSYEHDRNKLIMINNNGVVEYALCLHLNIADESIARAGDEGVITGVLWGSALGKLRMRAPGHYRRAA